MPKATGLRCARATASGLIVLALASALLGGCGSGCVQGYHWSDANQTVFLQTDVDWANGFNDTVVLTGQCAEKDGHARVSCLMTVPSPVVMAAGGAVNIASGNDDIATGTATAGKLKMNWQTVGGDSRNVVFTDNSCSE